MPRLCVLMLIATGRRKVQTSTTKIMKAYRKHNRNQCLYSYHQCQLGHLTPGSALLISMCILMLPMVQLLAEQATKYHVNPINQWYAHQHHMNTSHTPLVLPGSLSNVLPAMVLQNSVVSLTIGCPSYTSSHSSIRLHLNLLTGLGKSVVGVMLALLLLLVMSGDIKTNPGPLGQVDLKSLHSELHQVADKWYTLGVQLQVPIESLKSIRRENLPMTECLLEMLTVWLKCTTPPPTWNILTEALESPPMGERLLAQQLRDKYCQGTEKRVTHGPSTVTPPVHTDSLNKVKQQVEELEERFCDMVDCTYKALLERNVDDVRLFRSIFLSLDVSRKHEHREFIHDHLMKMDKETTFDDLWMRLADYCNFMNFDLLEHVVRRFAIADLKQKMKSYEHDLQSFRKDTRLCDFIDCWPVRGEPSLKTQLDLREFIAKMKHDWDSCTLEDLEELKGVITHKFFLPEFALRLREIKEGCITITWLFPVPFMNSLQEAIETTSSEFFIEHKIETITIDRKDCYPSPTGKSVDYPKVQYTTQRMAQSLQTEIPPVSMLSEKVLSFKAAMSGEELPLKEAHRMRLAEEIASTKSSRMVSFEKIHLGMHPTDIYQETFPPKQKFNILPQAFQTKHMSKLQQKQYTSDLPSAEKYVREKCVDEISGQVKLLPSVEQYLSKAEVEANPSLPTKYKDYLSSTPAIRAALYTTFNAKMAAEVFTWSQHTESPPPTTMTELFAGFTLKTLVDHLSTHPVYCKQQLNVTTFSDLPTDVYQQFQVLCKMAFDDIVDRQQLVFSAANLTTGFAPLGLMQEVPQLYTEGRASSYHFIHLTLQEYLAAVHISQLPSHEQTKLFHECLDSGHFMRFLAGLKKLPNMPPEIIRRLMNSDNSKLAYFHLLFEAKEISVATKSLGSDEMVIISQHNWTPLDYYVTGNALSHSNCPWRLYFRYTSNDKFELFCQGCAAPGETGIKGCISCANFVNSDITYRSIDSFINISPLILQDMQELFLYDNKLDRSACDLLAKAVPLMSKLEYLWLYSNPIGQGGAVKVTKSLCGSGVKMLSLDNTKIGVPDCEALCELLKSSHLLECLHIEKNTLSSESVATIITGLSQNSSVTTLNISNSLFSMGNAISLASVLTNQSKCKLTWLELQNCHISEKGASELAAALCKNSILERLYLNHNNIGLEGASSMSVMLQQNTSLEVLNLLDDSVREEGVCDLINSLKHNQTLKELWLPKTYKSETSDHRVWWWR